MIREKKKRRPSSILSTQYSVHRTQYTVHGGFIPDLECHNQRRIVVTFRSIVLDVVGFGEDFDAARGTFPMHGIIRPGEGERVSSR